VKGKTVKSAKPVLEPAPAAPKRKKLSYKDQRELEQLPERIEQLEAALEAVQARMSDPTFFKGDPAEISAAQQQQSELQAELETTFARWDELDQLG
jgi:ATP-binding cassette subfamily F protein uup